MPVSSQSVPPVFDGDVVSGWSFVHAVFGEQPDARARRLARRKLYNLIKHCGLPAFRVNRRTYGARRTELYKWLADRERAGANGIQR